MAKSYVKFETPKEVSAKALEAVSVATDTGKIRKGTNEVTKSIEGSKAQFVVIAEDVDPEEVVLHIPMLCSEKGIPFCYVPTRKELGTAAGMVVPTSTIAVEKAGNANEMIRDVAEALKQPLAGQKSKHAKAEAPKAEEKAPEAPAAASEAKDEKKAAKPKKPRAPKKAEGEAKKE